MLIRFVVNYVDLELYCVEIVVGVVVSQSLLRVPGAWDLGAQQVVSELKVRKLWVLRVVVLGTMIFYEAPHKLLATLESMAEIFGPDRGISLCRELTKLHEEVVRTTLGQAIERYTEQPPKGEFVLVVAGCTPEEIPAATPEDAAARVSQLMAEGISRKDAIKQVAKELDLPKNVVYDAALTI